MLGLWGHSPPVEKTLQIGRDFFYGWGCLISVVLNKIYTVLLPISFGGIHPGGHYELGCYEKLLVMVNILKIHPQKLIHVFCFWIHSKDLLLFWLSFSSDY